MSQCRERSERRKNQQFGINENYWYTCTYLKYTFMSQAYMFKHNVDTAWKYEYPLGFQIILHI